MWPQVFAVLIRSSVQAQIKLSAQCDGRDLGFPVGSLGAIGFYFRSQCWSSMFLSSPFYHSKTTGSCMRAVPTAHLS